MSEPAQADPGRIKGAAFREFVAWWERTRGEEAVQAAYATLPAALATSLDPTRPVLGILASTWYPAQVTQAIVDGLIRDVPRQELRQIADDGADAVMGATLSGVYKAVFGLIISPERYAKYSQKIWDMHYDTGRLSFELMEPNVHHSTISDWHAHHEFICMLNMASSGPIYRAMGCKSVSYDVVSCVSRGDDACRSVVRWT